MMNNEILFPLIGTKNIKLKNRLENVINYLKDNNIKYSITIMKNNECDIKIPWTLVKVENEMILFFAKDILWKIYCNENFKGQLDNGIKIGMNITDAIKIDDTLKYDDFEEDYSSTNHYWLEASLPDNIIKSITIYIIEAENYDVFEQYKWTN